VQFKELFAVFLYKLVELRLVYQFSSPDVFIIEHQYLVALYQQTRTNLHGTMFSCIGHMQNWRKLEPVALIVLRSWGTFQNCTIVLYSHAKAFSKLYCTNLSQGKFKEKRNSHFWLRRIFMAISISLVKELFNSKLVFIKVYFTQLAQIFTFKNTVYASVLLLVLLWWPLFKFL